MSWLKDDMKVMVKHRKDIVCSAYPEEWEKDAKPMEKIYVVSRVRYEASSKKTWCDIVIGKFNVKRSFWHEELVPVGRKLKVIQ